ncbi:hypothetical protein CAPTEDRAFT_225407 [Capitella teleta]|uniref:Arf-GAP domain-containing protein n=1 Tax=Capitella teleta TaxID=283909 RepID=R7U2E3_CAPTE|nr:hypothetical protein CAPTEDRAFT_225407 [Capitella teleta]|eukprot:ELT97325.1 hypothetical protein CAPTEDRAFT_225407 [Capitella teleta]
MAANKRKQDEKHLRMLREMVALPHNKTCFDCHQRGPTYVNMAIGAFVCTSCSGLLQGEDGKVLQQKRSASRGLNPPHRVKSISMTSFTPEEMDFLRLRGNELCRQVWLGLYDNRSHSEPDSKDENKVKDFMCQKYEKKRWYVAPTDSMHQEAKKRNTPAKQNDTKPLRTLVGPNMPSLIVQNSRNQKPAAANPPPVAPQPVSAAPAAPQTAAAAPVGPQPPKSSGFDLLGDLGGDPFAQQPGWLQPMSSSGASTTSQATSASSAADRYAALTALNEVETTKAVNWDGSAFGGTGSSGTGPVPWGGGGGVHPPASSHASLASTSVSNPFAVKASAANPFGASAPLSSSSTPNPFAAPTQLSTASSPNQQQSFAAFGQFGSAAPAPPASSGQFMNGGAAGWPSQPSQPSAMPQWAQPQSANAYNAQPQQANAFGSQPQQANAFGSQPQQANAFGSQPQQANAFGSQPQQANAFGSQPQQANAFGSQPANSMFGKAPQEVYGAQQQAFAAFGQPQQQAPATANPFMNSGQPQQMLPPRSNSTNPFL